MYGQDMQFVVVVTVVLAAIAAVAMAIEILLDEGE
jgi:hypothetical protein